MSTKSYINVGSKRFAMHNLMALPWAKQLPYSMRILLENVLRNQDGVNVTNDHVSAFETWVKHGKNPVDIPYSPARVLMQDFTGVPAVVDLVAMRDAVVSTGVSADKVQPLVPVDLVIDHSVIVDYFGDESALDKNIDLEYQRNTERYKFLKWGQSAFNNFRVVPPGMGICHQVNLEYLAQVVRTKDEKGEPWAFPDTVIGTDSHTTMINGLGVLGWGVGGIEAEATALGQSISLVLPEVIGFKITGAPKEGVTATDIVLTITQMLREKGVVEKFVEFFGDGVAKLSLADRATISNMSPEYGATCGYFPIDDETINYLRLTNRPKDVIERTEQYAKAAGLWRTAGENVVYTDTLELDLSTVEPSLAGPSRPQDKVTLKNLSSEVEKLLPTIKSAAVSNADYMLKDGSVVIAAITSCTNTSNPSVMIGAALLAKKASELGLSVKPWVKTSFAPGSQVVTEYLNKAGLTPYLAQLGFNLVGYGCTTCIGNSGPLSPEITSAIQNEKLDVAAVLSGNRNFEGRVHPHVKLSFLASPPLVVAYALAGTTLLDFEKEPIGLSQSGVPIYLKDIWPRDSEIKSISDQYLGQSMFAEKYAVIEEGNQLWQKLTVDASVTYPWDKNSNYIQLPPYFESFSGSFTPPSDIKSAKLLALLGDSVTTDHISPAGSIPEKSAAGEYLISKGVSKADFNSYGSRRGNHHVMMRGTFANIRLQNELTPEVTGGYTLGSDGTTQYIYDVAMEHRKSATPLVIVAGKEYGTGSSRDWAAKGTRLLGVKAVIAESFERIHRSNLVGMGVLPLTFVEGVTRKELSLTGKEMFSVDGISDQLEPGKVLNLSITYEDGMTRSVPVKCRLDTPLEVQYYQHGGVLPYVLRKQMM